MEYLIVVFSASIDAYLAGVAYCLKKRLTFWQILYAGSFTFFVSLAMLFLSAYLKGIAFANYLSAFIFIFIGYKNYLSIYEKEDLLKSNVQDNSTLLGVGVSIDAGVACLAIPASGFNIFLYAFEMSLGHFLFLLFGSITVRAIKMIKGASFVSGVLMILLGIVKLCGLT